MAANTQIELDEMDSGERSIELVSHHLNEPGVLEPMSVGVYRGERFLAEVFADWEWEPGDGE